jgi:hypothetical protein
MADGVQINEGIGPKIASRDGNYSNEMMKLQVVGLATVAGADDAKTITDIGLDNPLPVADLTLALTGQAAQTAIVNNILESVASANGTAVDRFRAGSVQVTSTGTAGTFIFEQSNDNTNWVTLPVFIGATTALSATLGAITATASSTIYTFPIRALFIRLRIATTITGGSIQAFTRLSTETYAPLFITAALSLSSTARAGFMAAAGIWYDDTSTALAGNATFTGTSRDATVTATATAMAHVSAHAKEVRACAESDVTGTLWLEISRDNSNWRRIRSVATSAITGGGFAAELTYLPSWRYWRIGFTNGVAAQARLTVGTIAMAG